MSKKIVEKKVGSGSGLFFTGRIRIRFFSLGGRIRIRVKPTGIRNPGQEGTHKIVLNPYRAACCIPYNICLKGIQNLMFAGAKL